jgi:hypothetical protein
MPAAGNFTRITLGEDDERDAKLFVEGATDRPDDVEAIYIALAHRDDMRTRLGATGPSKAQDLPSVAVPRAAGASKWIAAFAQVEPPYEVGDTVLAVGVIVANQDGEPPAFWHQALTVLAQDASSHKMRPPSAVAADVAATDPPELDKRRDASQRAVVGLARHGIPGLRGQVAPSEGARFGRMFAEGTSVDDHTIVQLAKAMVAAAGESNDNLRIPAGYTYFGQFVDHDLTFEPTSTLGRYNDPRFLQNFRTPRFDLDSLYGSGPMAQPFLYDWLSPRHRGVKLLVGVNPEGPEFATDDLPRNRQGRALVGDGRNDENLIISQLHLLFIQFHNKVVDHGLAKEGDIPSTDLFEKAQRLVRWHYQWIVRNDFLPRIVGDDIAKAEPKPSTSDREEGPFMPVEFSVGAYRFGHSMVRDDYRPNDGHPNVPILTPRSPLGPTLAGFRRLPAGLEVQWKHFFFTDPKTFPQRSMRIDPSLAGGLGHLPPDNASLAYLNLRRGNDLGLPCGGDVADAMKIERLGEDDLLAPLPDKIDDDTRRAVLGTTPLWYYILCEARAKGGGGLRLGPTGGRIVAEVINGLLKADGDSYVNAESPWMPVLPRARKETFTMADLVKFTQAPPPG